LVVSHVAYFPGAFLLHNSKLTRELSSLSAEGNRCTGRQCYSVVALAHDGPKQITRWPLHPDVGDGL